jgi:hypothetical protein
LNQHQNTSSNWLVRSSGRVLGPFSDKELEEKIIKKEISIIDEISTPWQRWDFVREFPMFYDAVEKVRQSVSISEGSMTNIAGELTKTGYKISNQNESLNAESPVLPSKSQDESLLKGKTLTVSSKDDEMQESKVLIFSKYFFALSLLAFSCFVLYKRYFSESNVSQKESLQVFVSEKDKVLHYENLLSKKKINYDQFHELILLKINIDESSANVKNLLDQAGILFPAIKNQDYQFLQGMQALHEQDYARAEMLFQNAQNEEGRVNFLISLYGQKKYHDLVQQIQKNSFTRLETLRVANQMTALALAQLDKEIELKRLTESLVDKRYDILNEMLLLAKGLSKKTVFEFLKKDLIFHQRFVENINISNQWLKSFFNQDVCRSFKIEAKEVQVACFLLVKNISEANLMLKELELSKPQQTTVQFLSIYYDLITNQQESARIKSKILPEQSSFLDLYFKSENCFQNKDKECFLKYQSKILNFENRNEWKKYFELQTKILNNSDVSLQETSFLPIKLLKANR